MFGLTDDQKKLMTFWFIQWLIDSIESQWDRLDMTIEICKSILQTCGEHPATAQCSELYVCLLKAQLAYNQVCENGGSFTLNENIEAKNVGLPATFQPLKALQQVPFRIHLKANLSIAVNLCYEWRLLTNESWMDIWLDQLLCFWEDVAENVQYKSI